MPPLADTADASRLLKALADETRLRIVRRLAAGECCVCDLTDELGVAQSLLSFHLRILRDAGLITDRREGRWVYYDLARARLEATGESLLALSRPATPRRPPRRCA